MKKNPGRKERRNAARRLRKEEGRERHKMQISILRKMHGKKEAREI